MQLMGVGGGGTDWEIEGAEVSAFCPGFQHCLVGGCFGEEHPLLSCGELPLLQSVVVRHKPLKLLLIHDL